MKDRSPRETPRFIAKSAAALFDDAAEREAFLRAVQRRSSGVTTAAWLSEVPAESPFRTSSGPTWLLPWMTVAADGERPGKCVEHEQGAFYCLDLSSTFACAAYSQVDASEGIIIDLCAAPGGKGIVAWRYFRPRMLIGNEVIRKRTAQLISNYRRCRIAPAVVTSLDPKVIAEAVKGIADLVIVDAPCSGQSLLAKGLVAPGAFHPTTVGMNSRRQRRILAHATELVAPGGALLYSTCTFAPEENEENLAWLLRTFPGFTAVSVASLARYQSHLTSTPCYRLWPHQGEGAGSFCALVIREGEREPRGFDHEGLPGVVWRGGEIFQENRAKPG